MNSITINGEKRSDVGKKATKATRSEGKVPCVIYGGNEVVHIAVPERDLRPLVYTPNFYTADINVDGNNYNALLKDIQFHPVTDKILHIDFQQLVEDTAVVAEVPIRVKGVAKGVRAGGKLLVNLRKLKIRSLPSNLVDQVVIDVTNLELGKSLRVRDIELPEGVNIVNAESIPVATVEITRSLRAARNEAAKAG